MSKGARIIVASLALTLTLGLSAKAGSVARGKGMWGCNEGITTYGKGMWG